MESMEIALRSNIINKEDDDRPRVAWLPAYNTLKPKCQKQPCIT